MAKTRPGRDGRKERRLHLPLTVVGLVLVVLLVAAVWVVAKILTPGPPTLAEVREPVTSLADETVATIPSAAIVSSDDRSAVVPCPLDDGRRQYILEKSITLDPDFDRSTWIADAVTRYDARDGWQAHLTTLTNQQQLRATIVNRALMKLTIVTTDAEGGRVTLRATSACGQ